MKLKRIISLISSLSIVATMAISFETVSMAEKVDNKPEITVGTGVDGYGYYYVEYKLNMNGLGVVETTSGRDKFYNGIGLSLVSMKINGVSSTDVYESIFVDDSTVFEFTPNLSSDSLQFSSTGVLAVSGLYAASPSPVAEGGLSIAKISTNYEEGTIEESELIEKFSDFGFTSIKTATIPESSKSSDLIANENITTYSVGDDGYTKHVDADFALITPETPESEPPVQEDPEVGDVIEVEGKTAVIDDDNATRFVVSATESNIGTTTATSVLKATYAGTAKQANLWNLLGIENQEESGTVVIGSLTVKAVLPATVTEASQVGAFSITVE